MKQRPKKYILLVRLKGCKPSTLAIGDSGEVKREMNKIKNTKGKYVNMDNGFIVRSEIVAVYYKEDS